MTNKKRRRKTRKAVADMQVGLIYGGSLRCKSPSFNGARFPLMARGSAFALPGAGSDGVVLPLLAAAYEEHDEAEDEHDGSPGEIEVDAHGFFVDGGGVAGEEAVEAHEAADE